MDYIVDTKRVLWILVVDGMLKDKCAMRVIHDDKR